MYLCSCSYISTYCTFCQPLINNYRSADWGPVKELFSLGCFHVDAAMGHRSTEVVVPICAVEGEAPVPGNLAVAEKHDPGHIGQIIIGVPFAAAAGPFLRPDFAFDGESTFGSRDR